MIFFRKPMKHVFVLILTVEPDNDNLMLDLCLDLSFTILIHIGLEFTEVFYFIEI